MWQDSWRTGSSQVRATAVEGKGPHTLLSAPLDAAAPREILPLGLLDSLGAQGHELAFLDRGPRCRSLQIGQGTLEMGLDIACNEFIAVQHLFPCAPLSSLDQEAAKATALLVQTLDMRNQIVGRANARGASVYHRGDDLVGRTIDHCGESHGLLKVLALIASCPNTRLGHGLFAAIGQKHTHPHAP